MATSVRFFRNLETGLVNGVPIEYHDTIVRLEGSEYEEVKDAEGNPLKAPKADRAEKVEKADKAEVVAEEAALVVE